MAPIIFAGLACMAPIVFTGLDICLPTHMSSYIIHMCFVLLCFENSIYVTGFFYLSSPVSYFLLLQPAFPTALKSTMWFSISQFLFFSLFWSFSFLFSLSLFHSRLFIFITLFAHAFCLLKIFFSCLSLIMSGMGSTVISDSLMSNPKDFSDNKQQ